MRELLFTSTADIQFKEWAETDKKIKNKIIQLLENALQNPFSGIGKPEPLKHQLKGCWSRRINKEHRLLYQVTKIRSL